jgi:hypothetical protein
LWEDGLKRKASQSDTDTMQQLKGIEIRDEEFDFLKEEDKFQ